MKRYMALLLAAVFAAGSTFSSQAGSALKKKSAGYSSYGYQQQADTCL